MKKYLVFAAFGILALSSCGPKQPQGPVAVKVDNVVLKDTSFVYEFFYPATVQGLQDVAIYPQVEGRLTSINVKEGQRVKAGQVLFVIDQIPYKAALDVALAQQAVAESQVASAALTVESKQKLFDQDVISEYQLKLAQNELLTAKAQLARAKADVQNARNSYSFTTVTAPVSGLVGIVPYKLGTLVGPTISQPLTSISDNSQVEVVFSLPENIYLQLAENDVKISDIGSKGLQVEFVKNNGKRYEVKGKIKSASGMISKQTGAITLRAIFDNADGQLLSGGAGRIALPYVNKDAILFPRTCIKEVQNKMFVFRITSENVLEQVPVNAERINNKLWMLLPMDNGEYSLSVGDRICTTTNKLKSGDPVLL